MTDSSCHSTERHRKAGHTSLPSPGFFSFQQRRGWRVSSMMLCLSPVVYRNSPSYASLVTSKTFMLYTWYSLACMLNFSVALVLRIIWIKIVLKIMLVKAKVFPFFFFQVPRRITHEKVRISIWSQRHTLLHYIPAAMVVICDSSRIPQKPVYFQT